jgi:serine/threonine-protein kinase
MAFRRIDAEGVLGGRYRLQRSIASGGMAEVWEAQDDILGRRVAVKVLHSHLADDSSFLARFRREAIAAARLAHPNVVATYDTGVDDGVAWIVMERVDGSTLRQVLSASGPLSPERAVRLAVQVADALDYAHRAGVIHRDVKPANILVAEGDRVKVADFGIAKAAIEAAEDASGASFDAGDLTQSGAIVGTAKYLSPEQVNGEPVDGRSDVYALGVVLYEMLSGKVPFTGETDVAVAVQHATATPLPLREVRPDVPAPLEAVVVRAMAKAPGERYQSAADLRAALVAVDRHTEYDASPGVDQTLHGPTLGATDGAGAGAGSSTRVEVGSPTQVGPAAPRPAGGGGAHDTPAAGVPAAGRTTGSRVLAVVVAVVLVATLGLVGVLFARSDTGQRILHSPSNTGGAKPASVAVVSAAAFDPPPGDLSEHDADVANVTDNNPATAWSSEQYGNAQFGGLKTGVGVVLTLNGPTKLGSLEAVSTNRGWSAQVFVANTASASAPPTGWGSAVATKTGIDGTGTFALNGRTGSVVLLWITDMGGSNTMTLSDVHLTA